jgi:hypothetical protein
MKIEMTLKTWKKLIKIKANILECAGLLDEIKNDDEALYGYYEFKDMAFIFSKSYDAFKEIASDFGKNIETEDDF